MTTLIVVLVLFNALVFGGIKGWKDAGKFIKDEEDVQN